MVAHGSGGSGQMRWGEQDDLTGNNKDKGTNWSAGLGKPDDR
jgi:hypothetical protein